MENNPNSSSSRSTDRKVIERNRRNHMKSLYSKLNSLVPHPNSRESTILSLPDQLDEAANYIKSLQINLERMKERKESLMGVVETSSSSSSSTNTSSGPKCPEIQIQEMGSSLVIGLTTASNNHFIFNETIRILHEEGAEIVNANFSLVGDTIFHTIHLMVGESIAEVYGAARISERLKKFIQDADVYDK